MNDFGAWNSGNEAWVKRTYISPSQMWQNGDFNGDGKIDMNDFGIWNNMNEAYVKGTLPPLPPLPITLPEPSSFVLLAAAAALGGLARWRRTEK